MSTDATEQAVAAADARARVAAVRSLRRLLYPQVVAVAGAGRRPRWRRPRGPGEHPGRRVHRQLVRGASAGRPDRGSRRVPDGRRDPGRRRPGRHRRARRSALPVVAEGAPRAGGAVVLTAGLGEVGATGAARQPEIVRVARGHGMRLVGPNCLGVLNTDPAVRLDATFSRGAAAAGRARARSPVRRRRHRHARPGRACRARRCQLRLAGQQGRRRGNDLLAPGTTTRRDRGRRSTWSRSATRGSSPGSPAASPSASRCSPSSAAGRGGQRAGASHTAAAAPRRRRSRRCSPRPA